VASKYGVPIVFSSISPKIYLHSNLIQRALFYIYFERTCYVLQIIPRMYKP